MQIHKIIIAVIDFDEIGTEQIKEVIENTRYPNRCISPEVLSMESREIGEWHDEHPLNFHATAEAEIERLFSTPPTP